MPPIKAPSGPDAAAVYVHFPYCRKKCPYCDFNSHVAEHQDDRYADAILKEAELRAEAFHVPPQGLQSIYFGGGTPSLWAPEQVGRVIQGLQQRFGLQEGAEITLEANPGTIAEDRFAAFMQHGVGRFSIGCQSFIDEELSFLGRLHQAEAAEKAVRSAISLGARVSLDLMYGFPKQSFEQILYSLEKAIELSPEHISAYSLTIEPETVFGQRARLGLLKPMPDDSQAELIQKVSERLAQAGYHRYEISNYCQPGFEARHNSLYWIGGAYLGLGAGAHGYLPRADLDASYRYENLKSPTGYLERVESGRAPHRGEESRDRRGLLADRMLVALRAAWGLHLAALDQEFGQKLSPVLRPALETLLRQGLVEGQNDHYWPTAQGFLFNDRIALELLSQCDAFAPDLTALPTT